MDRRQFLVSLGRIGLAGGLTTAAGGCASPSPTARSLTPPTVGPRPSEGLLSGPPSGSTIRPRDGAMAAENRRPGTHGWDLQGLGDRSDASGFVDAVSVAPGDRLAVHLDSRSEVEISWYRLGWYGGAGGRLIRVDRRLPAAPGGPPTIDPVTGRAEAPWPSALSVEVGSDWPSGMYLAVFRPSSGVPGSAPFIVRPAPSARAAPVLFVSAATTWQAYNVWGGADFYDASAADAPEAAAGQRAVQVSFDRPYALGLGAGYQARWELPMVRWQEREGRDVDYCADVDLESHPEILMSRRLVVFAGHHEYWSRAMRTTLENAIANGVNVAFLSANEIYWQVRFEPSDVGARRRITCYKSAALDPMAATSPDLVTSRWRDPPVNDPEAPVIGQMYGHEVERAADWVVSAADHWLYGGTRLRNGDRITNLVGQEYDTYYPDLAPVGTIVLARSPVRAVIRGKSTGATPADPTFQTATIYTAESGATVFAAGTFQWSWALDGGHHAYHGATTPVDERVQRMTRNLFDRLGDGPA